MRRYFPYLVPYRRRVLLILAISLIAVGLQIALPLLLARAINAVADGGNRNRKLIESGAALLGLAALTIPANAVRNFLLYTTAESVARDNRAKLFRQYLALPPAFHDQSSLGDLMARATEDSGNVRNGVYWMMWSISIGLITILNVIIVMILLDPRLALVAALMLPLLLGWSALAAHALGPRWVRIQGVFGSMSSLLQDEITGVQVVRAFGRDDEAIERYGVHLMDLYRGNRAAANWASVATPAINGFGGLGLVVVTVIGGSQALKGNLDVGTFVAFCQYVLILTAAVAPFGRIVVLLSRGIASSDRITEMLARRSDLLDPTQPLPISATNDTGVRFDDVSFRYPIANDLALEHISFTVPAGATIGVTGLTGAGKSTLLHLMLRLYDPTSGSILVGGEDLRSFTVSDARKLYGWVAQDPILLERSARENISLGEPDAPMPIVSAAADAAQASDFIAELAEGFETLIGERGVTLSGGQRQRMSIARAVLVDPPILLLDDATASLDAETERTLLSTLLPLRAGKTTVLVANRTSALRYASEILVLENGKIVDRGTDAELRERPGFYQQIADQERDERRHAYEHRNETAE
jgi:ABC-type multidrug transport system fused ATPase/permease subunit